MGNVINAKEAAEKLGVGYSTLVNWRHKKIGNTGPKYEIIDNRYCYTWEALENFQKITVNKYNAIEAAKVLGVEKRILAKMRFAGELSVIKFQGLFYFEKSDINKLKKKWKVECHGCVLSRCGKVHVEDRFDSVRCEKWLECRHARDCSNVIPFEWPGFTADCEGFASKEKGYYEDN